MEKVEIAELSALVRRLQSGDKSAFDELYHATNGPAYFTALKIVGSEDDAEDVLQDSYLALIKSVNELKNPDTFVSWFNRIVANKAKDSVKKKNPSLFKDAETENFMIGELPDETVDFNPEAVVEQESLRREIMEMIDGLSDEKRICVVLYYYDEMPVKAIADSLNIKESTVKDRLFHARKEIKAKIEEMQKRGKTLLGISAVPLFIWALRYEGGEASAAFAGSAASASVLAGISGAAGGAALGSAAAGGVSAAGGVAAKIAALTVSQKVIAGVAAAAVIVSGAAGAGVVSRRVARGGNVKATESYTDIASVESSSENEQDVFEAEQISIEPTGSVAADEASGSGDKKETSERAKGFSAEAAVSADSSSKKGGEKEKTRAETGSATGKTKSTTAAKTTKSTTQPTTAPTTAKPTTAKATTTRPTTAKPTTKPTTTQPAASPVAPMNPTVTTAAPTTTQTTTQKPTTTQPTTTATEPPTKGTAEVTILVYVNGAYQESFTVTLTEGESYSLADAKNAVIAKGYEITEGFGHSSSVSLPITAEAGGEYEIKIRITQ